MLAAIFAVGLLRADPPPLTITQPAPGSLELSWDDVAPGYVLEYSGQLISPVLWAGLPNSPALSGGRRSVVLSMASLPGPAGFFRLITKGSPAGLDYLIARQNADGTWGAAGGAGRSDTAAAVGAFGAYGMTVLETGAYTRGLSALGFGPARNFDELSRRVVAHAGAGDSVETDLTVLLDGQNPLVGDPSSLSYPDRGWGLADGFGSTALDTALVLRAVFAAGRNGGLAVAGETVAAGATSPAHAFNVPAGSTNLLMRVRARTQAFRFRLTYPGGGSSFIDFPVGTTPVDVTMPAGSGALSVSAQNLGGSAGQYSLEIVFTGPDGFDYSRIATPLGLLGLRQNADGGWSVGVGEDSHWLATTETLRTLGLAGATMVSPAIPRAVAWLVAHQNADGGFSLNAAASSPYETALAMLALRDAAPGTPLAAASAYLRAAQLPDGSWEHDVGVTALAVQALRLPPTVAPIPNQTVAAPAVFAAINLDDFVADPDHPDSQIEWSASGQSAFTVSIVGRVATVTYPPGASAAEDITFTARDPDGLTASTTARFAVNLADHTIARGTFATGTRNFTTTPAVIAATAFFSQSISGLPAGVSYSTTGVSIIGSDTIQISYRIDASAGAAVGSQSFQVTYSLLDGGGTPLGPLTGNTFTFTILVTP